MVACGERSVFRTIASRSCFGQFRAAPMHLCRASRLWHALQCSSASQDQKRWGLRQFASRRTISLTMRSRGPCGMKLPAKIVRCGPHGPLA